MAIAVIGGLLVSTVLSLVFVPSFFTVMDDVGSFVVDLRPLHRSDGRDGGVPGRAGEVGWTVCAPGPS